MIERSVSQRFFRFDRLMRSFLTSLSKIAKSIELCRVRIRKPFYYRKRLISPKCLFFQIYHEDEFECSDVCECEVGEKLSCKTICIDRMPCKTEFAYYNHAAPAYQAFRGRCLCYSGRFICMKPSPSDYNLPQGVFLFLGYSEVDEKKLNINQTRIVVQDVVRVLQNFIKEEAVNGVRVVSHVFIKPFKNLHTPIVKNSIASFTLLVADQCFIFSRPNVPWNYLI